MVSRTRIVVKAVSSALLCEHVLGIRTDWVGARHISPTEWASLERVRRTHDGQTFWKRREAGHRDVAQSQMKGNDNLHRNQNKAIVRPASTAPPSFRDSLRRSNQAIDKFANDVNENIRDGNEKNLNKLALKDESEAQKIHKLLEELEAIRDWNVRHLNKPSLDDEYDSDGVPLDECGPLVVDEWVDDSDGSSSNESHDSASTSASKQDDIDDFYEKPSSIKIHQSKFFI